MDAQWDKTSAPQIETPAPVPARATLAVFAAALLLYVVSMAPGVLWQDSGLAQVRVLRGDLYGRLGLALSHPLYYTIAFAFQALPFAESAWKTNLVSAVFGALTVTIVFVLLAWATRDRTAALIGAISLAVAHTFWQHCALAEVYTVTTALLTGELLCLWRFEQTRRPGLLAMLFLLNGLGVSNHMLAVLSLACYGTYVLVLLVRGRISARWVPVLAFAWVGGASLYLGMIVAQIVQGADVGATIQSALFGVHFRQDVLNVIPSVRGLVNSVLILGLNFPTPVALLAPVGLVCMIRRARRSAFSAVFLGLVAIHLAWAVRYDVPDQYTFFIPTVVLIAILIGLGAQRWLAARGTRWRGILLAGALVPAAVYLPLPAIARSANLPIGTRRDLPFRDTYAYFLRPWKTGNRGARQFADALCEHLPPDAVIMASTTAVRPIHYAQLTGRWRDDIRVYPPIEVTPQTLAPFTEQALQDDIAAGRVFVVDPYGGGAPRWMRHGAYEYVKGPLVYQVRRIDANPPPSPTGATTQAAKRV
jgi:hypothetical protein